MAPWHFSKQQVLEGHVHLPLNALLLKLVTQLYGLHKTLMWEVPALYPKERNVYLWTHRVTEESEQTYPQVPSLLLIRSYSCVPQSYLCMIIKTQFSVYLALNSLWRFLCLVKFILNKCICFSSVNLYFVTGASAMNLVTGEKSLLPCDSLK